MYPLITFTHFHYYHPCLWQLPIYSVSMSYALLDSILLYLILIHKYCFSLRELEDMGDMRLEQPKWTSNLRLKAGAGKLSPIGQFACYLFFVNKVLLELSHIHVLTYVHGCFMQPQQSWVVAVETIWHAKPKILIIWLFIEKVCWPLASMMNRKC